MIIGDSYNPSESERMLTQASAPPPFTKGRADYNNKCNSKKVDFKVTKV